MSIGPISRYDRWKLANGLEEDDECEHDDDCDVCEYERDGREEDAACECEACEEACEGDDDDDRP